MEESSYWNQKDLEQFISSFQERYPCEAVSKIVYCQNVSDLRSAVAQLAPRYAVVAPTVWELQKARETVAYTICDPRSLGKKIVAPIFVYPPAKKFLPDELTSILRDHEYVHALDWAGGVPITSRRKITKRNIGFLFPETIHGIMEARAIQYQLEHLPKSLLASDFERKIRHRFLEHIVDLENILFFTNSSYECRLIGQFLNGFVPGIFG